MGRLLLTALVAVASTTLAAGLSTRAFAQAPATAAVAPTALDRYLQGLATLRTEFAQEVTDARGRRVDAVVGQLIVQRPGRFRWEIRPADRPDAAATQIMVADGRNVWFHDLELEQITVRPAGTALTATPAMLLSGTVELRQVFTIDAQPRAQGLEWVRVRPRRSDAEFREARLGFAGGELRRMEIDDRLGQKSVLRFGSARRNAEVTPAEVSFAPPAGVDVIGKPVG